MSHNTARRGITLIIVGVAAVMVLAFGRSGAFTPARADALDAAPLCGNAGQPVQNPLATPQQ